MQLRLVISIKFLLRLDHLGNKIKSENLLDSEICIIRVFSWTQLRYNISGWFGMGHALKIIDKDPEILNKLKLLLKSSKFFSQLLDNMSFEMARMRLTISKLYAKSDNEKNLLSLLKKIIGLQLRHMEKSLVIIFF